jgi:hypothetical protein
MRRGDSWDESVSGESSEAFAGTTSSRNPNDPTELVINRLAFESWEYQYTANAHDRRGRHQGPGRRCQHLESVVGLRHARLGSADPVFWYNGGSAAPLRVQQSNLSTSWAIDETGAIDKGIHSLPWTLTNSFSF